MPGRSSAHERAVAEQKAQYAATVIYALAKALKAQFADPRAESVDASVWARLYVEVEAELSALAMKQALVTTPSAGVDRRASFRTGYVLYHTHVLNAAGMIVPMALFSHQKYNHEAEAEAWVAFSGGGGGDAHKRAAAVLKEEREAKRTAGVSVPVPVPAKPSVAIAHARQRRSANKEAALFPAAPDAARTLESASELYELSFARAKGGGPGGDMRGWPRFVVRAVDRSAVYDQVVEGARSMSAQGGAFPSIVADESSSAKAFVDWVERLGLNQLSSDDAKSLRAKGSFDGDKFEERRRRCGLKLWAFGSYNSVWVLAEGFAVASEAEAAELFFPAIATTVKDAPGAIVFRVPLAEMSKPTYSSTMQAVDEIANMLDAASAGFGVPVYATGIVQSEVALPGAENLKVTNHRVCAVLERCTKSCDRRVVHDAPASIMYDSPKKRVLGAYFDSLNHIVWCMSLRRRLNLDVKLANFVDTFSAENPFNECPVENYRLYVIDLESTTYRRLPVGETSHEQHAAPAPEAQGWRPIYLYNALLLTVQLRLLINDPNIYHELWWSRLRPSLATLLAQVRAGTGYDEEFRSMAQFVRDIKWTGPLPVRGLPELPEVDNPRETTLHLAENYAGYYLYGAYTDYLAPGRAHSIEERAAFLQAQTADPQVRLAEGEAKRVFAADYDTTYRHRLAPLLRFFADRRDTSRDSAAPIVDLLFEFADAPWSELVRQFVDVLPPKLPRFAMQRYKSWRPLITGAQLAEQVWSLPAGSPSWRAARRAAEGARP